MQGNSTIFENSPTDQKAIPRLTDAYRQTVFLFSLRFVTSARQWESTVVIRSDKRFGLFLRIRLWGLFPGEVKIQRMSSGALWPCGPDLSHSALR